MGPRDGRGERLRAEDDTFGIDGTIVEIGKFNRQGLKS